MKLCCLVLVLLTLAVCVPAWAQGTASDYARADGLAKRLAGKVYRASVTPHWVSGECFWYRNALASGRREFIDACWKDLTDAKFPDRIIWIKAARSHPWRGLSAGHQRAVRTRL